MVEFLISASFRVVDLIRERRLLEDGTYSGRSANDAALIRGRRLFETRRLIEEIQ